jgi:hypothetical protein
LSVGRLFERPHQSDGFSPNDLARVLNAIGFGQQDEAVWNTDRAGNLKAGSGA